MHKKIATLLAISMLFSSVQIPVLASDDVGHNAFYVDNYTPTDTNWDEYDIDYMPLFLGWNRELGIYNITYDLQGGQLEPGKSNPDTYQVTTESFTLNNPSKRGYTFDGWSGTGLIGGHNKTVTISQGSTGDRDYTAEYLLNQYEIEYDYNGGVVAYNNKSRYSIEDPSFTLTNPVREGYSFDGYTMKVDGEGVALSDPKNVTISQGSAGNRQFKANYTKNPDLIVPYIDKAPDSSAITEGDVLGLSILSGGEVHASSTDDTIVPGTWIWDNQLIKPALADSNTTLYDVTFIPDDDTVYTLAHTKVTVEVLPFVIEPICVEKPVGSPAYADELLGSSILSGGEVHVSTTDATIVDGRWIWDESNIVLSLDDSETTDFKTWFIPNDTRHYKPIYTTIKIKVTQKQVEPYIKEKPEGSAIYEHYPLGKSILTGGVVTASASNNTIVNGKWLWDLPSYICETSDSQTTEFKVWFIPNDTVFYKPTSTNIKITVNELPEPYVDVLPTGSPAYEKDPLGSSILSGGVVKENSSADAETVSGCWIWDDASYILKLTDSQTTQFKVWFIPSDGFKFKPTSRLIKITVLERPDERLTPYISTPPNGSDAYSGEPLGSSVLSGGVVHKSETDNTIVNGKWMWDNASYELALADSETTNFKVWFIPTDTFHYKPVSTNIKIKVKDRQIYPYISENPHGSDAHTGEHLGSSILTGGKVQVSATDNTAVQGKWMWDTASYVLALADSETTEFKVWFVPTNSVRYLPVSTDITIKVTDRQIKPYIAENPTGSDAYAQELLGSSILTGGEVHRSVSDNTIVTGKWMWDNASYELALADSETTEFKVWFMPNDTANYLPADTNITIKVTEREYQRTTPFIKDKPSGSQAYADDYLGSSILTGGEVHVSETDDTVVTGRWLWQNAGTILKVSDNLATNFETVFIPDDIKYTNVSTSIKIPVIERHYGIDVITPVIKEIPSVLETYEDGDNIGKYEVQGGKVVVSNTDDTEVIGRWVFKKSSTTVSVSDNNTTEYEVIYVPNDSEHYKNVTTKIKVKVKPRAVKPVPVPSAGYPTGTAIYAGDNLEKSYLIGGRMQVSETDDTEVKGSWYWRRPKTVVTLADSDATPFNIMFIPEDMETYANATGAITITVLEPPVAIEPYIDGTLQTTAIYENTFLCGSRITGATAYTDSTKTTEVPGMWLWKYPNTVVTLADSNTTDFVAMFVPDNNTLYTNAERNAKVEVLKVPEEFEQINPCLKEDPTASEITEGNILGTSKLTGGIVTVSAEDDTLVAGRWIWDVPDILPTLDDSNNTLYNVTFIPDDYKYANIRTSITVTVVPRVTPEKIDPYIDGHIKGSDVYENTYLGGSIISGAQAYEDDTKAVKVSGNWIWKKPDTVMELSDSEKTNYEAIFIPYNTMLYNSVVQSTTVKVKPLPEGFKQIETKVKKIPYCTTIYDKEMIGTSIIEGGEVTVSSDSTKIIKGRWVWKDPYEIVRKETSETKKYKVIFIPDSYEYKTAETEIFVITEDRPVRITPSIDIPLHGSRLCDGDYLGGSKFTGGIVKYEDEQVDGQWFWANASTVVTLDDNETTEFKAIFIPAEIETYNTLDTNVKIKVGETPEEEQIIGYIAELPVGSDIYEGDYLAASILTGGKVTISSNDATEIPGKWYWSHGDIKPTLEDSQKTIYDVIFIPDDRTYASLDGGIRIRVLEREQIENTLRITKPESTAIVLGQSLKESKLVGGSVIDIHNKEIPGHFEWVNDAIYPELSDSDKTPFDAEFIPDNANDLDEDVIVGVTVHITEFEKIPIGDIYISIGNKPGSKHKTYSYNFKYTGMPISPKVYATYSQQKWDNTGFRSGKMVTRILKENVDYTIEYRNNINVGTGQIVLHGIGDFDGEVIKTFSINQKTLRRFSCDKMPDFVYDGTDQLENIKANVIVRDKGRILDNNDYIIQVAGNTVGSPDKDTPISITVKANTFGNYKNAISKEYKMYIRCKESTPVNQLKVRLKRNKRLVYNTRGFRPPVVVTDASGKRVSRKYYTINYMNNINAGTCSVVIKGCGKYYGTAVATTFEINPANLKDAFVPDVKSAYYRAGLENIRPKVKYRGVRLEKDKDYVLNTLTYDDTQLQKQRYFKVNSTIESATPNFTGSHKIYYKLSRRNLGDTMKVRMMPNAKFISNKDIENNPELIKDVKVKDKIATGLLVESQGNVVVLYNNILLQEGIDYDLQMKETKKSIKYIAKGKGIYTGRRKIANRK